MGRSRFVAPEVVRLTISEGDWIDVKRELNAGETRRIYTDLIRDFRAGEQATLDPKQVGLTKILNYVVGWSFVDADNRPVPFSQAALENLDTDSYKEIADAIDAHDTASEKARAERKNARTLTTSSEPIS